VTVNTDFFSLAQAFYAWDEENSKIPLISPFRGGWIWKKRNPVNGINIKKKWQRLPAPGVNAWAREKTLSWA
jgi:hypothetical protein